METTFPVPTPIAGLPEEYACLTIGVPPVAKMKSTCFIRACEASTDTYSGSIACTRSAGAPNLTSTVLIASVTAKFVFLAFG
ncbi:hypothetical protein SDC9_109710 [bioreactor metagenome]|uniref:Uncharacterized protein n=1 Tax=bioreactor metagenome TaxID=1076179 RepID=A0A645BBY4_9ZZZZ